MSGDAKLPIATACPICSEAHADGQPCLAPYERAPMSDEINDLPEGLRRWIHDLEANADPAGTLRECFALRENLSALAGKLTEAEAQRAQAVEQSTLWMRRAFRSEAQRDRLVPLVAELLADVEADVLHEYAPNGVCHPANERRMNRDLDVVVRARQALAEMKEAADGR